VPPANIKTIRQLIYWEYSKLISGSAVGSRKNYGFVMHTFKKLDNKQIHPSSILRENKKLVKEENHCAYCDCSGELHWEHIIPKSRGGPDTMDNMVQACPKCNLAKSDKDPFEWYGEARKYEIPRIVLGKYLKLVFDFHENKGTLDSSDLDMDGSLNVFDLGAIFKK